MDLRERINKITPLQASIGVGACILLAFLAYLRYGRSYADGNLTAPVVLKCTNPDCSEVVHTTLGRALADKHADEMSRAFPGAVCRKCGQNTLAWAWECPNDQTVFFRKSQAGPIVEKPEGSPKEQARPTKAAPAALPKCPQCGWDPAEWQREEMRKSLR